MSHTLSNLLQRILEWYLDLPAREPGQVLRWSLTGRPPWPSHWPMSVVWLLLVGLTIFVIEIYRRDARSISRAKRATLICLRCFSLGIVLLLLTQLSLSIERTGLPEVVVLIDDSASMGLRDAYRDEADQKFVADLFGSNAASDSVRFELVRRILSKNDGRWLQRLRGRHKVRVMRFSDEATPLGPVLLQDEHVRLLLAELQNLKPTGDSTRPAAAVQQILNQTRGTPPAAIVLLTDGIASNGDTDKLSTIVPLAREQLVPLFVIGFGSDEPTRDVQLAELIADNVAFVNDPIVFTAKVKVFGFKGQSAVVELREKGSEQSLGKRTVTLPIDGQTVNVDLLYTPTQSGDREFEVVVIPPPGDVDRDNNRLSQAVRVREGKLKILLADGLPRWEFRELKNTLEREPTIELHTLLQEADLEFALQDETAKPLQGRFPLTREALSAYDVLLLGDLNPGALTPGVLENVREFVREGGGVLAIAGPNHMPMAFRGSPIETLLPIELDTVKIPPSDAIISEPFRPQWTAAGQQSTPLFRHLQLDGSPREVWRSLPGLYWLCEAPRMKPGATVLVEHSQRRGEQQPLPVIVLQRFGAGKVLFHATDELWRWRFRGGERLYSRYWVQALRYLSRTQNLTGARGVEFTSDRQIYQRGESVRFRLQFLDERQLPTNGKAIVMIERIDEPRRSVELSRVANSQNVFISELRGLRDGRYHALVVEPSFPGSPPSVDFQIEVPQRELLRRRLEKADLTAAARATHGRYFVVHEADQLPEEFPLGPPVPLAAATVVPLWTRWELLALFAIVLSTEWLCRRRWRLI